MTLGKKNRTTKATICHSIHSKTNVKIEHVNAIVNIFLDEMRRDLKKFRLIKIKNFGTFQLKKLKPRKAFNVSLRKFEVTERPKRLKFTVEPRLSGFLTRIVEFIDSNNDS